MRRGTWDARCSSRDAFWSLGRYDEAAQAYQRIKNVLIPNMYYRTDIGDRWVEDHDKLHTWGYLRES